MSNVRFHLFFFFSSRRRHTRLQGDWSSDVCSSDLAQEAVRETYRQADIFALPCVISQDGDRDGIPTVLLEAMASGLSVVSTRVSGIPELVESGRDGILVEPGNPEMLADALDRLLSDEDLRKRLGLAASTK